MKTTRLLSLFLSFFLASFGVAAEVFVGDPQPGPSPGFQLDSAVASDGQDFLAVWRDGRGGRESLLASRITNDGEVLDPYGIPLVIGELAGSPRVVWTGNAYVIVWQTNSNNTMPMLMAARLDRDGKILTYPKTIATMAWSQTGRFVATNGSRVVVGYTRFAQPYSEIRATVLDTDLNVVDDLRLAGPEDNRFHIGIAANDGKFLAVWYAQRGPAGQIEAVRLNENGALIDAQPRVVSTGTDPDIASDGSKFVIVVRVPIPGSSLSQAARTIDFDYERGDLHQLQDGQSLLNPFVVWTGSKYVVVAQKDSAVITATNIAQDGVPQSTQSISEAKPGGYALAASAATNGSRILVTWMESTDFNRKHAIRARLFDASSLAPASEEMRLTNSANEQRSPVVAFDGTNHLVVWSEESGIYATRVTPDGQSLEGRGAKITSTSSIPRVQFDGAQYIVAWADGVNGIAVRFVSTQGVPGTELHVATQYASMLDLASNGATSLLVWEENAQIKGARIQRATQTISSPVLLSPSDRMSSEPTVSGNGVEFLVAWTEFEVGSIIIDPVIPSPLRIRGTRVTPAMSVRDPETLLLADTAADPYDWDSSPELASNGTDWLMLWSNDAGLNAVRIRTNGKPGTPAFITQGSAPDIRWDGTRFAVAYRESAPRWPVYRTFITNELVASAPQRIAYTDANDYNVSIARALNGQTVVAYSRWSWLPEHGGVLRAVLNVQRPKGRAIR